MSRLGDKIQEMEAQGSTALGPALAVAVGLRPQEIIVCTDGEVCFLHLFLNDNKSTCYNFQPNVGVGSLQGTAKLGIDFYRRIAEQAKANGTSISCLLL